MLVSLGPALLRFITVAKFIFLISVQTPHDPASPLLGSNDKQVVEEEEVDGDELGPHVEQGSSFGHLLQLSLLLQESILRDDRDGLRTAEATDTNVNFFTWR